MQLKKEKLQPIVHLGKSKEQWFEAWAFIQSMDMLKIEDNIMRKELKKIITKEQE